MYYSIISCNHLYEMATQEKEDLIVIGNCKENLSFDAIFNFQDNTVELPYKDDFLEKIKEQVADEPVLLEPLSNFHKSSESTFTMKNCAATAHFLDRYIKTNINLTTEQIKDILNKKDDDDYERSKSATNGGEEIK